VVGGFVLGDATGALSLFPRKFLSLRSPHGRVVVWLHNRFVEGMDCREVGVSLSLCFIQACRRLTKHYRVQPRISRLSFCSQSLAERRARAIVT